MEGVSLRAATPPARLEPPAVRALPRRAGAAVLRSAGARATAAGDAGGRPRLRHRRADAGAARRLEARETVGIDTSPAMLARTAAFVGDGLSFQRGRHRRFRERGRFRPRLLQRGAALASRPPGVAGAIDRRPRERGQLAVQVPANDDHPSHATAVEVASESPFREALGGHTRRSPVLPPRRMRRCSIDSAFASSRSACRSMGTSSRRGTPSSSGCGAACSPTTSVACRRSCGLLFWSATGSGCCRSSRKRDPTSIPSSASCSGLRADPVTRDHTESG